MDSKLSSAVFNRVMRNVLLATHKSLDQSGRSDEDIETVVRSLDLLWKRNLTKLSELQSTPRTSIPQDIISKTEGEQDEELLLQTRLSIDSSTPYTILASYDTWKDHRNKSSRRLTLRNGIINIEGKEFVFHHAVANLKF
jgi:hypothetical protein